MRVTVREEFSWTFPVSSTIGIEFTRPVVKLEEDLSSCDYLYPNLYLDFLKKSLNIPFFVKFSSSLKWVGTF